MYIIWNVEIYLFSQAIALVACHNSCRTIFDRHKSKYGRENKNEWKLIRLNHLSLPQAKVKHLLTHIGLRCSHANDSEFSFPIFPFAVPLPISKLCAAAQLTLSYFSFSKETQQVNCKDHFICFHFGFNLKIRLNRCQWSLVNYEENCNN